MYLSVPDPPTDLRAINVTDSKALLLWRPALATVDHYVIVYSSEAGELSPQLLLGNRVKMSHLKYSEYCCCTGYLRWDIYSLILQCALHQRSKN